MSKDNRARLEEIKAELELGTGHGCFTGDCPHDNANECVNALEKYAAELTDKGFELITQLEASWKREELAKEALIKIRDHDGHRHSVDTDWIAECALKAMEAVE